jgi:hypothetical protein
MALISSRRLAAAGTSEGSALGVVKYIAVAILLAPRQAAADAPSSENVLTRPHTVAEAEFGAIILPNAAISPAQKGGSLPFPIGKGDATIMTGLHLLFRGGQTWAVGAGALFAPHPTSDSGYGLGGATDLPRTHSRSYLWIGGEARYFPVHTRYFDVWAGITAGGIIIADRFANNAAVPVPSILGVPEVTVSTEGYAIGAQVGGNWIVTEHIVIGLTFRADLWFLPSTVQCSAFDDCSTLTGKVDAFEMGLTLAYRIAL